MGTLAPQGTAAFANPPAGDLATEAVYGVPFTAVGPGDPFAMRGPLNIALWASFNTALTCTTGSNAFSVAAAGGIAVGSAVNSALVPLGTTVKTFAGTAGTLALPPIFQMGHPHIATVGVAQNTIRFLSSTKNLLGATVSGYGIQPGTTVTQIIQQAVQADANGQGAVQGIVAISLPPVLEGPFTRVIPLRFVPVLGPVSGTDNAAIFTGAGITFSGAVQLERSFDGGATWLVANIGGSGTLATYTTGTPVALSFGEPERGVLYRLNCTGFTGPNPINYRLSQSGGEDALAIGQLI